MIKVNLSTKHDLKDCDNKKMIIDIMYFGLRFELEEWIISIKDRILEINSRILIDLKNFSLVSEN